MRLINASTLQLESFNDIETRPSYAILSHRWVEGEEVTFSDMQLPRQRRTSGWAKIQFCCQQALADGLEYAWVDTCCINKSSSAELSEAINSMYIWYSEADRCYAYLNDVSDNIDKAITDASDAVAKILESVWFTRAWTLQELIAPQIVVFYNATFERLVSKVDIADQIQKEARIPREVLTNPSHAWECPVGERMSWAANRHASRLEDVAYSLFGLFEVNMPLLYGEGVRAFVRLQEEIIRQSHDHSIFVWSPGETLSVARTNFPCQMPLLAPSPKYFEHCQGIGRLVGGENPYAMTNVGLEIGLPIHPYGLDTYVGALACVLSAENHRSGHRSGILLAKASANTSIRGGGASKWRRVQINGQGVVSVTSLEQFRFTQMYIAHSSRSLLTERRPSKGKGKEPAADYTSDSPIHGIKFDAADFLMYKSGTVRPYTLVAYHDWDVPGDDLAEDSLRAPNMPSAMLQSDQWVPDKEAPTESFGMFYMPPISQGIAGVVLFNQVQHGIKSIKVAFDFDLRPIVFLATHEASSGLDLRWLDNWQVDKHRFLHIKKLKTPRTGSQLEKAARLFWTLLPDDIIDNSSFADGPHIFSKEGKTYYYKVCQDWSRMVYKRIFDVDGPWDMDDPKKVERPLGIYVFLRERKEEPSHWTFKPYADKNWHISIDLEKRRHEGKVYWSLKMKVMGDVPSMKPLPAPPRAGPRGLLQKLTVR